MMLRTMLFTTLFLTSILHADIPLLTTGPGRLVSAQGTRGFSFEVGHELTVTGLAKFDGNGNGVLDDGAAPQVGIWDTVTSDLVVSAFIDDAAEFRDGLFVKSIEPVVLPAGTYTLGAEFFSREEPFIALSDVQSTAGISPLTPLRARESGFSIPSLARATLPLSMGPNLVIEQPTIALNEPTGSSIAQRQANGLGMIQFAGVLNVGTADLAQVRAIPINGGVETSWQTLPSTAGQFSGVFEVPGGWYQLEARALKGDQLVGSTTATVPIGVGEVFVVAGQSNSANSGWPPLAPTDERVVALDSLGNWTLAADPQPLAEGNGGSPWPVFGDLLAEQLDVPVGIASVGWGGTSVRQWLPGADGPATEPLYNRLRDVLQTLGPNGARAVLWHQGETDALNETDREDYARRLSAVIDQSRSDAGFEIPWGVALAAFQPQNPAEANPVILDAQRDVIRDDPLVFAGPNTDLLGLDLRYDNIHFNEEGLRQHAEGWVEAVQPFFLERSFLPADFDQNGLVDDADFLLLANSFRQEVDPPGTNPDIDRNGVVDFADFLLLSTSYGESIGTIATVPEPTTPGWMLLLGLLHVLPRTAGRPPRRTAN